MAEIMLGLRELRARNNSYNRSNIYRWLNDPASDFPTPVKIGARTFFRLVDIEAFEARQAERTAAEWAEKRARGARGGDA